MGINFTFSKHFLKADCVSGPVLAPGTRTHAHHTHTSNLWPETVRLDFKNNPIILLYALYTDTPKHKGKTRWKVKRMENGTPSKYESEQIQMAVLFHWSSIVNISNDAEGIKALMGSEGAKALLAIKKIII